METIQSSFTILIDHAPWIKDVIPAAIEDRDLLKTIESLVSLYYLICFAFVYPSCTFNRLAKVPHRHIAMTRQRSSYPVSRGSRKTLVRPWNPLSRRTARLVAGFITLSSPRCFVLDQSRKSLQMTASMCSIYLWTLSTYDRCQISQRAQTWQCLG
jgi:hypothetical protein